MKEALNMTLLHEETFTRYGYYPENLTPSSHKEVLFRCPGCGQIRSVRIRYYREGKACRPCPGKTYNQPRKPRWKLTESRPITALHPQIDRAETHRRFGYFPEELAAVSSQLIVWKCPDCNDYHESRERALKTIPIYCRPCTNRRKVGHLQAHNQASKEQGKAPSGKPLGRDLDAYREKQRLWRKNWRATPMGMLINRLRVSLKRVGRGYTTKNLPYGPEEFVAHITARLEAHDHKCPLCSTPISYETCDVDHKIPLSSARTPEEALALFDLSNLDVLCPPCNQHVKRARLDVVYEVKASYGNYNDGG